MSGASLNATEESQEKRASKNSLQNSFSLFNPRKREMYGDSLFCMLNSNSKKVGLLIIFTRILQ